MKIIGWILFVLLGLALTNLALGIVSWWLWATISHILTGVVVWKLKKIPNQLPQGVSKDKPRRKRMAKPKVLSYSEEVI